jgi:hypothetical protein
MREARRELRHGQQAEVPEGAVTTPANPFADLVARLTTLGQPSRRADVEAVEELISVARSLLAAGGRRRPSRVTTDRGAALAGSKRRATSRSNSG